MKLSATYQFGAERTAQQLHSICRSLQQQATATATAIVNKQFNVACHHLSNTKLLYNQTKLLFIFIV